MLPYDFIEYKNEKGVITGEAFYNLLIESIEVDSHIEELVDIISYPEPNRKFLLHSISALFTTGQKQSAFGHYIAILVK